MSNRVMMRDFYNPTTWRFTVDSMVGTFTAKTEYQAQATLKQLIGTVRAQRAKLTLLHDRESI